MPTNIYGPGDNFDPESSHVITALIRKFIDAVERGAQAFEVWGTGEATREFLYVDDAAEGIILAEAYDGRDYLNLGSGQGISIRELAQMIAREVGFTGSLVWDTTKPDGQPRRLFDVTRAEQLFGFRARMEFISDLRQTIASYRMTLAGASRGDE